ncbi:MAG TPA: hypothetical protein VM490_08765 [Armatimonadaceae bacterium]|nr:hypothetical protein [Armatimonadaceae bacterium]
MKRFLPLAAASLLLLAPGAARAIDHDNIDGGRPLRFEDADSIAFRERAFEFGIAPTWPRGSDFGLGLSAEYLWGFALNSHVSLDFDPSLGGRAGSDDTRADLGRVGVGVFHNFNRETLGTPSFAVRADAYLPTGRGTRGVDFRLRGIMSRTIRGNERLHVNLDGEFRTDPEEGGRSFVPAVAVGYSRPIGYPRRFDRTALAEVTWRGGEGGEGGSGGVLSVGAGLRQQVTVRSVFDVGIQSDVAAARGAARDDLRLVAGYSTAF